MAEPVTETPTAEEETQADPLAPIFEGFDDESPADPPSEKGPSGAEAEAEKPSSEEPASPTPDPLEQDDDKEKRREVGKLASLHGNLMQKVEALEASVTSLEAREHELKTQPPINQQALVTEVRRLQDEGLGENLALGVARETLTQQTRQQQQTQQQAQTQADTEKSLSLQTAFDVQVMKIQQKTPGFDWDSDEVQAIRNDHKHWNLNDIAEMWALQNAASPEAKARATPLPQDTSRHDSPTPRPEASARDTAPTTVDGIPTQVDGIDVTGHEAHQVATFANVYANIPGMNTPEGMIRELRKGA